MMMVVIYRLNSSVKRLATFLRSTFGAQLQVTQYPLFRETQDLLLNLRYVLKKAVEPYVSFPTG